MNKKQLVFYAFMLTFGIACDACDDGCVKKSKNTTPTLPQEDNDHKNGLDEKPLTNDNPSKGNNPHKDDLDDKPHKGDFADKQKDVLKNYEDKFKPLQEIVKKIFDLIPFGNIEFERELTDEEEGKILVNLCELDGLVNKTMVEYAAPEKLKLINVTSLKILSLYWQTYYIYTLYVNRYKNTQDTQICIKGLECVKKQMQLFTQIKNLLSSTNMVSFFDEVTLLVNDNYLKETKINIDAKLIDIIEYDNEKDAEKVFIRREAQLFSKILPEYSKPVFQNIQDSYTTLANSNELTNNGIQMLQELSLKDILQLRILQKESTFYIAFLKRLIPKTIKQ